MQNPKADCFYEWTRALLNAKRAKDAYAAEAQALLRKPQTPGTQTAAGWVELRKGEIVEAEKHFRSALVLDAHYAGALAGLARVYSAISRFTAARSSWQQAFQANPDDPQLMIMQADTLKGDAHTGALERALALLDPKSEDAQRTRAHIALDRAVGGRKTRRLISPYETSTLKLTSMGDPRRLRGLGLRVRFNQSYTVTLLLDTGASGISLSPKGAEKAGLELLNAESYEVKGIGDKKTQASAGYLASEVKIGEVVCGSSGIGVSEREGRRYRRTDRLRRVPQIPDRTGLPG